MPSPLKILEKIEFTSSSNIKGLANKIRGYTDISFQKKSVALLYIFRGDYEPQALSMLKYN